MRVTEKYIVRNVPRGQTAVVSLFLCEVKSEDECDEWHRARDVAAMSGAGSVAADCVTHCVPAAKDIHQQYALPSLYNRISYCRRYHDGTFRTSPQHKRSAAYIFTITV